MRTRMRPDERKTMLLDAAALVFGKRGFEATRMEDVAAEAGVAKGLLYRHFASKDALFEALLDRKGDEFASALGGALVTATVAEPLALLRRGFELWVDQVNTPAGRFNFADPGRHDAYAGLRNRIRSEIVAVMDAAGSLVDPDRRWILAAAVQGAAESMVLVWAESPGDISQAELVDILTRFCWQGLSGIQSAVHAGGIDQTSRGSST